MDFGAGAGQNEQWRVRQLSQGHVEQLHRGGTAPVDIFDHEQQRSLRSRCLQGAQQGALDVLAAQAIIVAGGA